MATDGAEIMILERDHTVHRFHPSWCVICNELMDSLGWKIVGLGVYRINCDRCGAENKMLVMKEVPRKYSRKWKR